MVLRIFTFCQIKPLKVVIKEGPQYVRRDAGFGFFRGDIRDLSSKKGWEAGISVASGSGILCFYRVGMRD